MRKLTFIQIFLLIFGLSLFSQERITVRAEKRFEKYIRRHERNIMPILRKQLPVSIDSCKYYYIFSLSEYTRHDSIFPEDFQYPRFLKVHKPVRGFHNQWSLACIETRVISLKTKRYFHLGREGQFCDLYEVIWFHPDSILKNYMDKNNIRYCLKFGIDECCVLNNNNLWVSDGKEIVPFGEFIILNWIKFGDPHNRRVYFQNKTKQKKSITPTGSD